MSITNTIIYWLSEHPSIVNFQWSSTLWGASWSFLITSLTLYITTTTLLHLLLLAAVGRRRVPLGRLPALHGLTLSLISAAIFAGLLASAVAEIRDTRWLWPRRPRRTPFEWLLCFPIGTRPSGRVFFWSYAFYLSRFIHVGRTYIAVMQRRTFSVFHVFNHSMLICMSFLWLEFSQSFQVLAILSTTLGFAVVNAYRFMREMGLRPEAREPPAINFHLLFLLCNSACHVGVLVLHFNKGGCNGMEAWVFNSLLNTFVLLLFLRSYVKARIIRRRALMAVSTATIMSEPIMTSKEL